MVQGKISEIAHKNEREILWIMKPRKNEIEKTLRPQKILIYTLGLPLEYPWILGVSYDIYGLKIHIPQLYPNTNQ